MGTDEESQDQRAGREDQVGRNIAMHTSTESHEASTAWRWLKLCIGLVTLTDIRSEPTWTTHRNAWRNVALRVLSTSFVLFPSTVTLSRPLVRHLVRFTICPAAGSQPKGDTSL